MQIARHSMETNSTLVARRYPIAGVTRRHMESFRRNKGLVKGQETLGSYGQRSGVLDLE